MEHFIELVRLKKAGANTIYVIVILEDERTGAQQHDWNEI